MTRIGRTLGVCVFAALALALASCSSGGDDEDSASPSTAPANAPSTTAAAPTPTFTGQDSAQFCALAKTYTERFSNIGANPSPAQLRTVTREGQTAITQAVAAAPAEIKADIQLLATAFTALNTELERVNFEVGRLPPTALSQLSTPQFEAATTRFQAYTRTVCGVG